MVREKSCHKYIYKLQSKRLAKADWNLTLPLSVALNNKNDVVATGDSQLLRWIMELNGDEDINSKVISIKEKLNILKKMERCEEAKKQIKELYKKLYDLQYQKDCLYLIMNSSKDYYRANKGFSVNGTRYRRLLGTNGGVKKSTITYVSERIYNEIKNRMDNDRDLNKKLIPAKLEAYQALICSGSIPVSMPRIVIVKDCNVSWKEDVILIQDKDGAEPEMTHEKDYEINYCDSDGYGLMTPEYSMLVNKELNGDLAEDKTITGINTRFAWTKGMLFTFDYVDFARKINNGNFMIMDAWGTLRDVRDFDVILTTSMVKLWDSYKSLEHFLCCSRKNHYQFSVSKTTPLKLEHVRNANYQFLQTYEFTEKELKQLCEPTMEELKGALCMDWGKTLVFLKGMYLKEDQMERMNNDFIKALMIDSRMMNDPFILSKVYGMIKKRIQMAAKGSIQLSGNYAIVSGDLYSLAQSIFGLPVTGLLKSGEVYHRYWISKGVKEIACFRAPMTCHNNIRKQSVVHSQEMDYWYQYNQTGMILNSWDSTCDALNGADKDSDSFFTTDNEIILKNTRNVPTIKCVQRQAEKIVPDESHLVKANVLSFGDEIGSTTNKITSMIELQSSFKRDSLEYRILEYRIMCGQHYQQNSIDKAKGIISKPMPRYWYDKAACGQLPETTEEEKKYKKLCSHIVADKKPYFMRYIYPELMKEYKKYTTDSNKKCIRRFQMPLKDLEQIPNYTPEQAEFLEYHQKFMPTGNNLCTINRICHLFEEEFGQFLTDRKNDAAFDYTILKCGINYQKSDYKKIETIKIEYDETLKLYQQTAKTQRLDKEDAAADRAMMMMKFRSACESICPNALELCEILLDMCYTTNKSKQFVWDVCGDTIIQNLLIKNNNTIHFPVLTETEGEFKFGGESFIIKEKKLREDELL